jgi:hypothetical protein
VDGDAVDGDALAGDAEDGEGAGFPVASGFTDRAVSDGDGVGAAGAGAVV